MLIRKILANKRCYSRRFQFSSPLLLAAICLGVPAFAAAPPVASPEAVVREFYGWYLKAGLPQPKRSNLPTFRKYNTQGFLKRAMDPNVDSVLFIDAQDLDETWANNFSVGTATIHGRTATTEVTLTGQKVHYTLSVTLRQESGAWKIDGVKGKDWKDVGN